MKWDNLTMSQKQALMKIYVNNGVTNLDEIVNHYNRFSEGGSKETVEPPNTVMYSRIPRESVGNVVNNRPVPGLITMTEVPRMGAGINLPFKELIDRFVLDKTNTPNIINTDSITRPVSYITRPRRVNRFDDGGEFTLTDIIEGNSFLDYLKNKYKDIDPSKDSNKLTASDVTSAISSNIKSTTEGLSKTAQQIVKDNEEKIAKDIYNYKLMGNSLATAAELASAAYGMGRFMKNYNLLPNSRILNGRYFADSNQILMNGLGTTSDAYQLLTADSKKEKIENSIELSADIAGIIGGTNWFRNTPFFGRYGSTIDNILDFAGYSAAAYDGIIKPTINFNKKLTKKEK